MWRGAGAWSHASGRSGARASYEFDKSHQPYQPNDSDDSNADNRNEPCAIDEFCDSNNAHKPAGRRQYALTA